MQQQQFERRRRLVRCDYDIYNGRSDECRSWTLLILSLVVVSLSGGLVYGWPALRLQLEDEGTTLSEKQLGLVYTVGAWSTQGGRFFFGLARDRYGTRLVTCVSLVAMLAGAAGVGLCDANNIAGLCISLALLGFGSAAQLCLQPVAGLFPNHVGVVLSSLSGAFQISGLVFLILSNNERIISYLVFSGSVLLLTVVSAVLLPKGNSFLPLPSPDRHNDDDHPPHECSIRNDGDGPPPRECSIRNENGDEDDKKETQRKTQDGHQNAHSLLATTDAIISQDIEDLRLKENDEMKANTSGREDCGIENDGSSDETETKNKNKPPTLLQQMKTAEYVLLCAWMSIAIIPMQYYIGIIGYQLDEWGDDTGLYSDIFSYLYAGAAVTAPLAGFAADKFGLGFSQGLVTIMVAASFLFLAVGDSLTLDVQTVGLALYGIGRMGIFGLYFTNCGKRFGYDNYGTLAGLGLLTSAVTSLLQYPLIAFTVHGHGKVVYAVSGLVLAVLQVPYSFWLYRRETRYGSAVE